jgi:hypothetical protein
MKHAKPLTLRSESACERLCICGLSLVEARHGGKLVRAGQDADTQANTHRHAEETLQIDEMRSAAWILMPCPNGPWRGGPF